MPAFISRHATAVLQQGGATLSQVAEAFYVDLTEALGEAPGQEEAFEQLCAELQGDAAEIWYGAMMGFGLALAADSGAELRAAVAREAAALLLALDDPE